MPIYEYECSTCNQTFEIIQKFSDPVATRRPDCTNDCKLTKLVSKTSFQLKGSGWYATDYKKSSSAPTKASSPPEMTSSKTEEKPKPESKPATGHKCGGGNCH